MSRFLVALSTLMCLCSSALAQTSIPASTSAVPPSPTVEAAKLANHVYDLQAPLSPHYSILGTHNDPASGFQATAYHHAPSGRVTVAFRGTDERADWAANQGIGRSEYRGSRAFDLQSQTFEDRQFKAQLQQAQQFTDRIREQVRVTHPNAEVTLTGHSLGGALAQVEGARTGLKTTTFNAPGMVNTIKRLYPDAKTDHIHNHVRDSDLPSRVSTQAGNIYQYPTRDADAVVIREGVAVNEGATLWWQPQWYRYNHDMRAFYVDLLEGMTTNNDQQPGQASVPSSNARRTAQFNTMANQNEVSAANRAAAGRQQSSDVGGASASEMMQMLMPAAIAAQQQRAIQPPLAAPAGSTHVWTPASSSNPICFGPQPGCYNDGRKLDTSTYNFSGSGSNDSTRRRLGPGRPVPGHR